MSGIAFRFTAVIAVLSLGVVSPNGAAAQAADSSAKATKAADSSAKATKAATAKSGGAAAVAEFAVPELPAVSFLNGSTANISRPTTPKALLSALASGVNAKGKPTQGFGLEITPASLIPLGITLSSYQENWFSRALANVSLSIATVATAGDTTSTDVAYAVRATLYDDGDPMLNNDYLAKLGAATLACAPSTFETDSTARAKGLITQLACMDAAVTKAAKDFAAKNWNATRIEIAYGGGQRLIQSELSNRADIGYRAWVVAARGLGKYLQGIGYVDYNRKARVDTSAGYTAQTVGLRLNGGSASVNGYVEHLWQFRSGTAPGMPTTPTAWSGGIEFKTGDNTWISTGFGKQFQDTTKPDHVVVLANIRWGIASKPGLSPTP